MSIVSVTQKRILEGAALAWDIIVYRQKDGGAEPATFETQEGARLADSSGWWVHDLAEEGRAIDLGVDGIPIGIPREQNTSSRRSLAGKKSMST